MKQLFSGITGTPSPGPLADTAIGTAHGEIGYGALPTADAPSLAVATLPKARATAMSDKLANALLQRLASQTLLAQALATTRETAAARSSTCSQALQPLGAADILEVLQTLWAAQNMSPSATTIGVWVDRLAALPAVPLILACRELQTRPGYPPKLADVLEAVKGYAGQIDAMREAYTVAAALPAPQTQAQRLWADALRAVADRIYSPTFATLARMPVTLTHEPAADIDGIAWPETHTLTVTAGDALPHLEHHRDALTLHLRGLWREAGHTSRLLIHTQRVAPAERAAA